jgi:hypothetical protein
MNPGLHSAIPPHGAYFLCRPKINDPVCYQRTTLYKISSDGGLRLQSLAHLKTSISPGFLQEFEPDQQWFGQRLIEVVSDEEAQEIIARETSYDRLLACCSSSLVPTTYLRSDDLVRRPFDEEYVLRVAKLMQPVELPVSGGHRRITHVSNAGDLIYGVGRDSIDCLSYLEVASTNLAAFVEGAIQAGFESDIENALKQQRKTFSPKLRAISTLEI